MVGGPFRVATMATIFTRIIEGEIPGTFIWRDDTCVSFLSINPLATGHSLVVPRAEIDHWLDLSAGIRDHLFEVSQTIGRAIYEAFEPVKVGLMIAGLEVPHCHIHVSPIRSAHDLDFGQAAGSVAPGELEAAADRIRERLREANADGVCTR